MRSKLLFLMLVVGLVFAGSVSAEMLIKADWEGAWGPDYAPRWWTWGSGDGPGGGIINGTGSIVPDGGVDDSQYYELDATIWSNWGWLMVGTNSINGSTGERQIACTPSQELIIEGDYKHFAGDLDFLVLIGWQDHTGDYVIYEEDAFFSELEFIPSESGVWEHITKTYTVPTHDPGGDLVDPPITHFTIGWSVSVGQNIGLDNLSVSTAGLVSVYPVSPEDG